MKGINLLAAAILLSGTIGLGASGPASAEKILQGQVCEVNVHKLTTEIDWNKSLHKAENLASEQGKLILWVHMVGKIDGAT
jgi:hypothetical protein